MIVQYSSRICGQKVKNLTISASLFCVRTLWRVDRAGAGWCCSHLVEGSRQSLLQHRVVQAEPVSYALPQFRSDSAVVAPSQLEAVADVQLQSLQQVFDRDFCVLAKAGFRAWSLFFRTRNLAILPQPVMQALMTNKGVDLIELSLAQLEQRLLKGMIHES